MERSKLIKILQKKIQLLWKDKTIIRIMQTQKNNTFTHQATNQPSEAIPDRNERPQRAHNSKHIHAGS